MNRLKIILRNINCILGGHYFNQMYSGGFLNLIEPYADKKNPNLIYCVDICKKCHTLFAYVHKPLNKNEKVGRYTFTMNKNKVEKGITPRKLKKSKLKL